MCHWTVAARLLHSLPRGMVNSSRSWSAPTWPPGDLASCNTSPEHPIIKPMPVPVGTAVKAIECCNALSSRTSLRPAIQAESPLMTVCCSVRGLDMPGRVDHVVNFDFPMNAVDYLHRTGRTARAGAPGSISSLVARRDQVTP